MTWPGFPQDRRRLARRFRRPSTSAYAGHIRALSAHDLVTRLRVERQVLYHAAPELLDWAEDARQRCPLFHETLSDRTPNGEGEPDQTCCSVFISLHQTDYVGQGK